MEPLPSSSFMTTMDPQHRDWTLSEQQLLKRLALTKFNAVNKFDVTTETKDLTWGKLTAEFNRTSYNPQRSESELRMEWERMSEKEYEKSSRRLLNRIYKAKAKKARARAQQRQQWQPRLQRQPYHEIIYFDAIAEYMLESSDDEATSCASKPIRTNTNQEGTSSYASNCNCTTVNVTQENTPNAGSVVNTSNTSINSLEAQLCGQDEQYWKNKVERINSECDKTGNKN